MVLTYAKYIELMTALDEHCKCTLPKDKLQDAIFNRYTTKYKSFVAENFKGNKRLFTIRFQREKANNRERKKFRNFMNISL